MSSDFVPFNFLFNKQKTRAGLFSKQNYMFIKRKESPFLLNKQKKKPFCLISW